MALAKRAKILSEAQETAALVTLRETGRYRERNLAMFLLSVKAGLRAKEVANLTWAMVTDAEGQVAAAISLENKASKGKRGGRTIPMNAQLRQALIALLVATGKPHPDAPVIRSERAKSALCGGQMTARSIAEWFGDLYREIGFDGCSSHSGRRTFITRVARRISQVGGSLRDVQHLAGHASLATTQIYIEGETEAQKKVVDLV